MLACKSPNHTSKQSPSVILVICWSWVVAASHLLRFVDTYKHVGTATPFDSHASEEVSVRCAMMRSGSNKLSKNVLCEPRIDVRKKLFVQQMYIMSEGT